MQITENIMQTVKNTIALSIKINTHRGYIGWNSCDNICIDMNNCLDMCYDTLALCLWHGGVRCAFGHTSVQGRDYSEKYRSPRQSLTVIHGSYSLPAVIALSE